MGLDNPLIMLHYRFLMLEMQPIIGKYLLTLSYLPGSRRHLSGQETFSCVSLSRRFLFWWPQPRCLSQVRGWGGGRQVVVGWAGEEHFLTQLLLY